ncbi:hypothetical protein DFS33DRAFT_1265288 [Desarmillaria ectypa]|nr:hypothetical protein DFS33DRAFT_1265288 [Desarmillaria ectypa]
MFNIIFDPVRNGSQLKRFNGDYYAEMKDEERTLTASPHCTLRKMNIRVKVDHPLIPWVVKVRRKEGIRCIDVFEAVYSCFNTTLTPDEELRYQHYLKTDWCVTAFKLRCAKSPGITYVNEKQGKRRVDLLGERTFFGGLTHDGDDKWTLALESHRRFSPCYM